MTCKQLVAALSARPSTVRDNMVRLLELGLIHIDSWTPRPMRGGHGAPVYAAGPGENAKYPIKDLAAVRVESRQRTRVRDAVRSRYAGNPFGVLIAQVAA
ncbi:hypothetical protein D3C87_1523630 [compost metagenome]